MYSAKAHLLWIASAIGLALSLLWIFPPSSPSSFHPAIPLQAAMSTETAAQHPCVVINEIAWGGTQASAADEWIELANTADVTVSLDGWRLVAADGSPDISLAGDIGPRAYFLIERTDDNTISDLSADLVRPFGTGLSNSGESLQLLDAAGQVIDTANGDGGPWPNDKEGAAPEYRSLERVSPFASDIDAHWVSNNGVTVNGTDALGQPVNGTPRAHNAAYLPVWSVHADIGIQKVGPQATMPGSIITYYLALKNYGGLTASSTLVTDVLPSPVAFVSQLSPYPFSHASGSLVWRLGEVPANNSDIITITTRVSTTVSGPITFANTATATTTTPELTPDNNKAIWTTILQRPMANLVVTKTGPAQLISGETLTYHITLANVGAYTATHALLVDHLPGATAYVDQVSDFPLMVNKRTLTWAVSTLSPSSVASISLRIRLTRPITTIDWVTNTVAITSETPDATPEDNYASWSTQIGHAELLISGVLYDGYQPYDKDEAIELTNVGTAAGPLAGWSVCKITNGGLRCYTLSGETVPAGSRYWLTGDAGAFETSFGFAPDLELSSWPRLANSGGEVLLRNARGEFVDALAYGDNTSAVPGWDGPSLSYYYNGLRGETGQILSRILDEATGLPIPDTDTAADWLQYPGDPTRGRRVRYPGWDDLVLFHPLSVTQPATVIVGIAPDHAFDVLSQTLLRARRTISIEAYVLTHPDLIEVLARKAQTGVSVTLLLEGNPVGVGEASPDWHTELYACQKLEAVGGQCWFMIHEVADARYSRYAYLHTKLAIVDDAWVALGSQNLTQRSLPSDDKLNGTLGSRGTLLVTNAVSVVQRAAEIFALDMDPAHHNDLLRWNTVYTDTYGLPESSLVDLAPVDGISYTVIFSQPLILTDTFAFELFTAPEAALRQRDALLGLLDRAGKGSKVYVEQMYERSDWGTDPQTTPNLRLAHYIAAARRGAEVRILLNGHSFAEGEATDADNALTAHYINALAAREKLDLSAALGNPTGEGIHNKMVLVGLSRHENWSHLGSINGSEASSKVNRELAIQIRSDEVFAYLARLFQADWSLAHPIYLPWIARNATPPPPPATHPLVSEVVYTGNPNAEWIEIYNPTAVTVDLTHWKLGDAESPQAFESMFEFPPGTLLPSGTTLVVAVNAIAVPAADLEFYESIPSIPNMLPYPAWGHPEYPLRLRDGGDSVLMLNDVDGLVDALVWGDANLPDIIPHPGVTITGASLERFPAAIDSDDCARDFRVRYPPTPGDLPDVP